MHLNKEHLVLFPFNISAEEVKKLRSRVENLETQASYLRTDGNIESKANYHLTETMRYTGKAAFPTTEDELWQFMKMRLDKEKDRGEQPTM